MMKSWKPIHTFWPACLALSMVAAACQSYGTGEGEPCADLSCRLTCSQDADCSPGSVCVLSHGGCCSQCESADPCADLPCGIECETDADCSMGQVCQTDQNGCCGRCLAEDPCAGLRCPVECETTADCAAGLFCQTDSDGCCGRCQAEDPCADLDCAAECRADADCPEGFACQTDQNGCCGTCQPDDPCAIYSCLATCASDADCAPGDVCHVYAEGCCSECRLGGEETTLTPACVHAPHLVPAGHPFPVAVFGYTGCASYSRVDIETTGQEHSLRVIGLASADPDCPQLQDCSFLERSFIGLVWLEAPDPGPYTVHVAAASGGDAFTIEVVASGGIVDFPDCQSGCPAMSLDLASWALTYDSDQPPGEGCGQHLSLDEPIFFDGSCQEYTAVGNWPYPDWTVQCTEDQILFGQGPVFEAEATFCPLTSAAAPFHLLGIGRQVSAAGEEQTRAFLLESRWGADR